MLNVNSISVKNDESLRGHCTDDRRVRKRDKKWEEMWFKTTAEDVEIQVPMIEIFHNNCMQDNLILGGW